VYFFVLPNNAIVTHLIKEQKKKKTDMTNTCIGILNGSNMYGFGLMDQLTVNVMPL